MGESEETIRTKPEIDANFGTVASDDLTVTLGREVSTINFYQDIHIPKLTPRMMLKPGEINTKLCIAIKIPTSKLMGIALVLPEMVEKLRKRGDLNRMFIYVGNTVNIPRKLKPIKDERKTIQLLSPYFAVPIKEVKNKQEDKRGKSKDEENSTVGEV